jgi:plasmid stabilization system protein ParE
VKTYRVELSEPAEAQMQDAYLSRSQVTSPDEALRWYKGLQAAIHSLNEWPRRFQMVEFLSHTGVEVRRMLYGSGRGAYHVIYRIIEPATSGAEGADDDGDDAEGIVRVQTIVSAVRRPPGQATEEEEAEGQ